MKIYLLFILPLILASSVNDRKNLSITIYNDGYAMVKDTRQISFDPQTSYLSFDDVAATIQPQTVAFRLENKQVKISILEQNFENNLVGKGAVLKKYLNKNITIYVKLADNKVNSIQGKLLSYSPSYILQNKQGVQVYDEVRGITLPELPEGLLTLPALVWKINNPSKQPFTHNCQIAYKATGFSWKSDYTLILNNEETLMDFAGWVTIQNNSGKKYQHTKVKLIAGDVNTVRPQYSYYRPMYMANSISVGDGASVSEKTFGDYHMYTINRKVDINESSTKQVEFIPLITNAKITKYYKVGISTGGYAQYDLKAQNMIKFSNSKDNKLGLPLPKGTIRTFKQDDTDRSLEFVGQDSINHTPKDQDVKIKIGNAFDLVIKKIVKSRSSKDSGNWQAELQLQITNHRNNTVTVVVQLSSSYGDNLEIDWKQSQKLMKQNVNKYNVTVKISPDEKRVLNWNQNYRVLY